MASPTSDQIQTLIDKTAFRSTVTPRGLTITSANVAQQLMPANANRRGFAIQNQSANACYINGQATATLDFNSLKIPAGAYFESGESVVWTGAISIISDLAGAAIFAREW